MGHKESVLATDFSEVDKMQELWLEKRKKKGQIYQSLNEYALFLESMIGRIDDDYEKWLIERELKKLKKLQKKYDVPSILELDQYGLTKSDGEKKSSLDKSSNLLVKRLQKDK